MSMRCWRGWPQIIPLTAEDLERTVKEIDRAAAFVPIIVADRLRWEDLSAGRGERPRPARRDARGGPVAGAIRWTSDFAHVVGYVGPVSDTDLEELEDPDPLLQIPKFQIGKIGVETLDGRHPARHARAPSGSR